MSSFNKNNNIEKNYPIENIIIQYHPDKDLRSRIVY